MKSESYGAFSGPSTNDDGVLIVPADGDDLPPDYRPTAGEEFMNPRQLAYFRKKLLIWKDEILKESEATLEALKAEPLREPDLTDRAASETDWGIELRTRDRQRKLISKIDAALRRIETGDYGWCEMTGEPISLQRLEARPIATMTIDAQERHERDREADRGLRRRAALLEDEPRHDDREHSLRESVSCLGDQDRAAIT
jgi:DnaK suppressor protein